MKARWRGTSASKLPGVYLWPLRRQSVFWHHFNSDIVGAPGLWLIRVTSP